MQEERRWLGDLVGGGDWIILWVVGCISGWWWVLGDLVDRLNRRNSVSAIRLKNGWMLRLGV